MKLKGKILCVLGVLGVIFICAYDVILGKPVNDITGPKSISALVLCVIFLVIGIRFLRKKSK